MQAVTPARRLRPDPAWLVVSAVVLSAALLRMWELHRVPDDPFYDAAVRSMGLSWHNFFFGAYDPSGTMAVDKPPLDLWLQVLTTQLFAFNSTWLKVPQALGGTVAVGFLFSALRRPFGTPAALCSAAALAVLPVSVLTARSDTMDSVMMALLVIAFWALLRAAQRDDARWVYLAAVAVGLAFNVKLLESAVAVPGLAVCALFALSGGWRRQLGHLAGAGATFVAVSLSWLTLTLLAPAGDRPFAIGSANGSAWNAAFVFNGYDRVASPPRITNSVSTSEQKRAHALRRAHSNDDVVLDHIPINSAGPLRLFDRAGPLSGRRLGYVLLAAILMGLPALALVARATGGLRGDAGDGDGRAARAAALGLCAWLVTGYVVFSQMSRLHPRYVEAFTPAVAASAGVGLAWACGLVGGGATRNASPRPWALAAVVLALLSYLRYLHGSLRAVDWIALAAAAVACGLLLAWRRNGAPRPGPGGAGSGRGGLRAGTGLRGGALAAVTVTLLALPATVAIGVVRDATYDSGHSGFTPQPQLNRLSAYLRAHRDGAKYEVAAAGATMVGSLIIKDQQPILVLTSFDGHAVVTDTQLAADVAAGRVRYALLSGRCHPHQLTYAAQCSKPGLWIRAHGTDVSYEAGQPQGSTLFRLGTH